MNQALAIYERSGVLYLQASSQTTTGLWIHDGEVFQLALTGDDSEIGVLVLRVAEHSRTGIPHPDFRVKQPPRRLLRIVGVRSETALAKSARYLSVHIRADIELTPSRPYGGRGGFSYLPVRIVRLSASAQPHEIGKGVREALERCETLSAS